jgi:hypothetical protein
MLKRYIAVSDFVTSSMAALRDSDCTELKASQLDHMKSLINSTNTIDHDDATALQKKLGEVSAAFSDDQRRELAKAVSLKMCGAMHAPHNDGRAKLQTCVHMNNYLTEAEWAKLDTLPLIPQKVDYMTDIMIRLGIPNPSEPTKVAAGVIIHKGDHVHHADFYGTVTSITNIIVKKRKLRTAPPQSMIVFPASGEEFQKSYPLLFPEGPPCPSKIENSVWESRRCVYGSRSSQNALKDSPSRSPSPPAPRFAGMPTNQQGMEMMQMMMNFMSGNSGQQGPYMDRNVVTMCPPRSRARSHAALANAPGPSMMPQNDVTKLTMIADGVSDEHAAAPEDPEHRKYTEGENKDDSSAIEGLDAVRADIERQHTAHVQAQQEKTKARAKAKAKAKAKVKAAAAAKALAKVTSKHVKSPVESSPATTKGRLVLGCAKCRYGPKGCSKCKDPSFTGKRGRP